MVEIKRFLIILIEIYPHIDREIEIHKKVTKIPDPVGNDSYVFLPCHSHNNGNP